ncbi:NAD(P)-dependent alcohol dehydrogenase [Bradyrhizobium zhanjiangense]|uniref:NAD(P)-dependent alcohol dehydrogenase n=1 Tax=Bradyrhizobium zhanjiangense TaxID=1325107 RepID=A0A4Q0QR84_9BRAD|nr:NAD(P)-dependent alcohol dehydrogenase [Bradyrhizobium zhanjiangense]RXG99382.1 NAD(P)-dependent alcohol dehydrogenase [Bradyrhizobium zhanjiangense]
MKIIAAIANGPRDPFEVVPCELSAPRASEVLVRVHACGICHTDLAVKYGHIPVQMPKVLGHEGAGVIEQVGPGVTSVRPGDHVLMSFGSCGECANCSDGALGYCDHFRAINLFGSRPGGSALSRGGSELGGHFFAQSAFASHAIATTRNIVKVDADLPLDLLAPLGCGIQTGMGSVMNVLRPQAGTSIAVFGVGAVGLSAIIAAQIVGCSTIIAVDVVPERLRVARELGATHAVSGGAETPAAEITDLTQGGAHFSLDTTGVPAAVASSVNCLRARGVSAQVAAPPRGTMYAAEASVLVGRGISIRGVVEGDANPQLFIPRMIGFFREGRLPLDKFVKTYPLAGINEAVDDLDSGRVVKPVLTMAGIGSA